jgi:hypothetical protein
MYTSCFGLGLGLHGNNLEALWWPIQVKDNVSCCIRSICVYFICLGAIHMLIWTRCGVLVLDLLSNLEAQT